MAPLKKRLNLFVSPSQFEEMEQIISPQEISQSDFIRTALDEHIKRIHQQRLEEELAEGYSANAKLDKETCADFKFIDGESI